MERKMPKGNLYITRKSTNTIIASGIQTIKAAQKVINLDAETSKETSYIVLSHKAEISPEVSASPAKAETTSSEEQTEAKTTTKRKFFK
jgi:hypothetical protein